MRLSSIVVVAAMTATLVTVAFVGYAKDIRSNPSAEGQALAKYTITGAVFSGEKDSEHRLAGVRVTTWEGQVAKMAGDEGNMRVIMETVVRPDGTAETEFQLVKLVPLARQKIQQKIGHQAEATIEVDGKKYRFEVTASLAAE